jgi:hypothetical protein|tara:strand:+ start:4791 stop:5321 length:531 start_codon:yes stop_codon:yes gene_type:complete
MSSFWSDASLEPKRKYRFTVNINNDPTYVVTKVKNPAVKISETPHKFLNHTFYYPGRAEWDPIDISFVDPGGPDDTTDRLYNKLLKSGYEQPDALNGGVFGFTKNAATSVGVGNVKINQLGVKGKLGTELRTVAYWELTNAFFTNISWGDYDYNGEEMLECSVTIRYDFADFINLQ